MRLLRLLLTVFFVVQFAACHRHPATEDDCEAILHRLIDLELSESGYRDPVLRTRWQNDLGHRFAGDLDRCRGGEIRSTLRPCLASAQSSEETIHRCLD